MDQHYQLTGDEAWLREAAPNMIKMCDWIIRKRKKAKAEQAEDSPVLRPDFVSGRRRQPRNLLQLRYRYELFVSAWKRR